MSPRRDNVLAGNPFAPLSELADEIQVPSSRGDDAVPRGARRVVVGRKQIPSAADRRPERKAVTLGDFIPPGEVPRKRPHNRRQRLSLGLEGMKGSVSSRVPLWSDRDRLTEMPAVPDGSPLRRRTVQLGPADVMTCSLHSALSSPRKRRRPKLAGLRGIVSNHFPTYTVRPYRPWKPLHRQAAPAVRQSGPIGPPPRPPPAAGRRQNTQEQASIQQPLSPGRHVPRPWTTSSAARPASREPPAPVAASPPPASPQAGTDTKLGSSKGTVAPTGAPPVVDPHDATRLSGTYRTARMIVTLQQTDWHDCPVIRGMTGRDTVYWVLTTAIQVQHPTLTGGRRRPIYLGWIRHGERLDRRRYPTDSDSLAELVRTGWEFEATALVGLRGGMDDAQGSDGNQHGQAPADAAAITFDFASATDDEFQQLDAAVQAVLTGRCSEDTLQTRGARQLLAPVPPQDWARLTDPILGDISPARILALRDLTHSNATTLRNSSLAPWTSTEPLVGIRFCEVQPGLAGWQGGSTTEAKQLIIGELMRIAGLGTAENFDWQTVKGTIRIEGELSATGGHCVWTVQAVIPQGPWIRDLLTGAIALIAGAYAVPTPHTKYIEVTLDPRTTRVLKGLWSLLGIDGGLFRGLIRYALEQRLRADMIGVRVTTSAFSHGGEGKKGKTTFFSPEHSDSKIVIGADATLLLQASRTGPTLALGLGYAQALPVTIQIPCPEIPGYALNALRASPSGGDIAIRYRVPGAHPTTPDVVIGYVGAGVDITQTGAHLPAGWLSEKLVNSQARKSWALQLLRQTFQREVRAITMLPVGRLKKAGGDPAYLFVMFPTVAAATTYCTALDAGTLPAALTGMLSSFFEAAGTLATFCAYIPPESIEACIEKDIVPLFKAGLTDSTVIKPTAVPNASV